MLSEDIIKLFESLGFKISYTLLGKLKAYEIREENAEICNIKMTVCENDDVKVDEIFKKIDCSNHNGYLNFSLSKFEKNSNIYLSDIIIKSDITGEFLQVTAKPESLLISIGKFDGKTETSFNRNHTIIYKKGNLTLFDKEDNSLEYNIKNNEISKKNFKDDILDFFVDERILLLIKYYALFFPELLDIVTLLTEHEVSKCFDDNSRSRKKNIEEQV